jgi:hypothetical protein
LCFNSISRTKKADIGREFDTEYIFEAGQENVKRERERERERVI